MLICLWVALRVLTTGSLPWKPLLATIAIFLLIYPFLNVYRTTYWQSGNVVERLERLGALMRKEVTKPGAHSGASKQPAYRIIRRVSLILPLSHVVESTPSQVPYWKGETYKTLFVGWIPRFLWPGKPEERWGNLFGQRYGILSLSNRRMSVNIPWVTELFANFGWYGIVFGMVAIGLFLAACERFLNRPGVKS